jgi:hypothetical protein
MRLACRLVDLLRLAWPGGRQRLVHGAAPAQTAAEPTHA